MNILVFSMNRPLQAEACIRSLKKYYKEFNGSKTTILYKAANSLFEKGFKKYFGKCPKK